MGTYEITQWINFNEYLITHKVKSNKMTVINNNTIQLGSGIEIVFNEDIQKVVDMEDGSVIFENDDRF